jgi:hypothetical protein
MINERMKLFPDIYFLSMLHWKEALLLMLEDTFEEEKRPVYLYPSYMYVEDSVE